MGSRRISGMLLSRDPGAPITQLKRLARSVESAPRVRVSGSIIVGLLLAACAANAGPPPTPTVLPLSSTPVVRTPATATSAPSRSPSTPPVAPAGDLLFMRSPEPYGEFNGSAWVAPAAGGPPLDLGPAIEAFWAADGQSVHLVSQDAMCVPRLTTLSLDGHVRDVVRKGLRSEDGAFAWSPDGRQIVFSRFHNGPPPRSCGSQGGTYGSDALVADLVVMNADGTDQRVLVPMVWPSRPITWSPDGTQIAFANAIGDLSQNLLGPVLVRVADGVRTPLTAAPLEGMSSPRWSPDGTRLAFLFYVAEVKHFGIITVERAKLRDLGAGDDYAQQPAWSPDGVTIAAAFEIATDGTLHPGGIVVHQADGSGRRELVLADVDVYSSPAWSPDGTWLAYIRTAGQGSGVGGRGIALVNIDGTARREVAETAGAQWVAWQPAP